MQTGEIHPTPWKTATAECEHVPDADAPTTTLPDRLAGPSPSDAPTPQAQRWWWPPGERTLLAILLVSAAVVRLSAPGLLEPNVSTVEVSNLAATETLIVNPGTGLLGWAGAGASGLAL